MKPGNQAIIQAAMKVIENNMMGLPPVKTTRFERIKSDVRSYFYQLWNAICGRYRD